MFGLWMTIVFSMMSWFIVLLLRVLCAGDDAGYGMSSCDTVGITLGDVALFLTLGDSIHAFRCGGFKTRMLLLVGIFSAGGIPCLGWGGFEPRMPLVLHGGHP